VIDLVISRTINHWFYYSQSSLWNSREQSLWHTDRKCQCYDTVQTGRNYTCWPQHFISEVAISWESHIYESFLTIHFIFYEDFMFYSYFQGTITAWEETFMVRVKAVNIQRPWNESIYLTIGLNNLHWRKILEHKSIFHLLEW